MTDGSIALALGGGSALGWAHIGVLRVLEEEGISVRAIAGTSIGALAAVAYASGRLNVLEQIARDTTRRRVLGYLDPALGRGAWLGGRRVARQLATHFAGIRLEALPIPIALVAADLDTGEEVRLTSGPADSAVSASIALPGLFRPVPRDGRVLIDGGMVANVPIAAARALVPRLPVVAVDLMGDYAGHARAAGPALRRSATGAVRSAFLMMMAQQTRQAARIDPPDVLVTMPVGHIGTGAFARAAELIQIGALRTRAAMPAIRALQSACKSGTP